MKKTLKLVWQTLKVFILFTGCTIFFYYAFMWLTEEYQNQKLYEEPEGRAVKVISDNETGEFKWFDRLLLFYLDGE